MFVCICIQLVSLIRLTPLPMFIDTAIGDNHPGTTHLAQDTLGAGFLVYLSDMCLDGFYANNFFHERRTQNPLVLALCCAHAQMHKYTFVQTYGHNNVQAYSFLLWLIQIQNARLFFPKPNIRQSDGHMLRFLASNLHFCIRFKLKFDN